MILMQGDCLEHLRRIPDRSVDLVLTDPPYNVGVTTSVRGKHVKNAWDVIPDYIPWCISWLRECCRVLKPNGVLYLWHNDMSQIAELLETIKRETPLAFISFCIWDKGDGCRAQVWHDRREDSSTALRSWFSVCEYCLHFFNAPKDADASWKHTGLDRINSNPACYKPLKDWIAAEKQRLGITDDDIKRKYTEVTGKKPYMLRHYFQDSQFELPTCKVWESVYMALGFRREYEELRREYEELRREYEELRNYHRVDAMHCNIWHVPPVSTAGRIHTCQKPVEILRRLIRVSCRPGGTVLDCFMGSGSTGVAAMQENRDFIGIEMDSKYFQAATRRIYQAWAEPVQLTLEGV